MSNPANSARPAWADAWWDVLAFVGGLGAAWYFSWETSDLVWSLWLSSLVIGYAMIVWNIFGPAISIATKAWGERENLRGTRPSWQMGAGAGVLLIGGFFMLAFFTVHFGGFHFVHSVFLSAFFPVDPSLGKSFPGLALYAEVLQRYWWFLPSAALAERAAFRLAPAAAAEPPDTAVTAQAIAARKAQNAKKGFGGDKMMAPYKNVIRLHLLIFFFAAAHFAKLDSFLVYAVVYAVYFFPWRLLKRSAA